MDDEYLLGDSLLVAPMTIEDGTQRKVYFPTGKWYDFWDDTVYAGGQEYLIEADKANKTKCTCHWMEMVRYRFTESAMKECVTK